MKKTISTVLMIAGLIASVPGYSAGYLSLKDAAVAQSQQWQKTGVAKPIMSTDGKVVFPYGQYQPTVTCAVLTVCDIEMQPGEKILNVNSGDTVRWDIQPATSGAGLAKIMHVVIKPKYDNTMTNLMITTDRRSYYLTLKSSSHDYVSRVAFYYPEDMVQTWSIQNDDQKKAEVKEAKDTVVDLPAVNLDKLDMDYSIEASNDRIKPVRVFNDGAHVYIQMSPEVKTYEAPSLVTVDGNGKTQLVNYRYKDNYYIVDKMFDKAELLLGADGRDAKVTIYWNKGNLKPGFWHWLTSH